MLLPQFLNDHQVTFETMIHPPAFTAQKRAHFLHIPGREVVKSVLLSTGRGPLLAVLPAIHWVDLELLSLRLETCVRLATPEEIADRFLDCERGTLIPFGTAYGILSILEDAIDSRTPIVFEAQRHALAIRMMCSDYERLELPRRLRFARWK